MISVEAKGIDEVIARVGRAISGVSPAVRAGLTNTAERATLAMEARIESAITETGVARAAKGGHPGRIKSKALIRSLRGGKGDPGKIRGFRGGNVQLTLGYTYRAPAYAKAQEQNPYSISGQLLALQSASNIVNTYATPDVDDAVSDMVQQTATREYKAPLMSFSRWT